VEINATLIGQLITFAVLVWFVTKYVWPPITKALMEREKKIAAGLEAAQRSQRELEHAERKALSIIHDAKVEATQIVEQAHTRFAQVVEEAKETARQEGIRIVSLAKEDIAREVNLAKEALRSQLVNLAVLGAEKIIKRNLDTATQITLLDEIISEI
jgi:F-type H+-transporting ATPase subunit b